jgi:hypothetical protein
MQIQPIDGAYFLTWFFWITGILCAAVSIMWNVYDEKRNGLDWEEYERRNSENNI